VLVLLFLLSPNTEIYSEIKLFTIMIYNKKNKRDEDRTTFSSTIARLATPFCILFPDGL
jgi:hypothetical protein